MPLDNAGINIIAQLIIDSGTPTPFDAANAHLGIGDGTTNTTPLTYTDLQGSSKTRIPMDDTYPTVGTNALTFQSTFGSGDANYTWLEWAIFNASTAGTMLSRKVENLGTKTAGQTWIFQATLTFYVGVLP